MLTCAASRTIPKLVRPIPEAAARITSSHRPLLRSAKEIVVSWEISAIAWDKSRQTTGILGERGGSRVKDKLCVRLRTCFVALFVIAVLILGLGAQLSFAQTEKASVSGRVTDQSNAAVPDTEVQITNTDTNIVTSVKTNGEGIYVIPSLNPGNYVMTINKQGFRTVSVTGVTLNVQDNLSRNFVLQIGSTAESVTVTAEAGEELVQTTTSDLGTVINQKAIHELPLDGRNFSQLLTLTPGATPISTSQSSGVGVNDLDNLATPGASVAQPANPGPVEPVQLIFIGWSD